MAVNCYNHAGAIDILREKGLISEIEEIAKSATEMDHREIQNLFKEKGWHTKGEQVKVLDDSQFSYDAYKHRVGVEIELSMHDSTFKDYFKFLIGQRFGRIDVGLLMVRNYPMDVAQPHFSIVRKDIERFKSLLPVPICLIGIGPTLEEVF